MPKRTFDVIYTDSVNHPERFFQFFDYENKRLGVAQQDVDYLITKDDKIIFIESKAFNEEVKPWQSLVMELIASDANKAYVVCRHYDKITEGTIPMLERAWDNQIVDEWWYNGEWHDYTRQQVTLKDFVNAFFKEKWGYDEPVVIT